MMIIYNICLTIVWLALLYVVYDKLFNIYAIPEKVLMCIGLFVLIDTLITKLTIIAMSVLILAPAMSVSYALTRMSILSWIVCLSIHGGIGYLGYFLRYEIQEYRFSRR